MLMLTGSQALKVVAPRLLGREPRDLDGIGTFDRVQADLQERHRKTPFRSIMPIHEGKKMVGFHPAQPWEFEIAWEGSSGERLLKLVAEDPQTQRIDDPAGLLLSVLVPSLDVLYALKLSHRYLRNSPAFLKTMQDIHDLRRAGASLSGPYADWFVARQKETLSYGHPNLNQGKMGFFSGDQVGYVFDHDTIHEAMAIHGKPAYTFYKKDGAEVQCDRNKWLALPEAYRLAGVLEESYVLALERSQIPFPGKLTPRASFQMALMKVCTSITSGWFREYAWENYHLAMGAYDDKYVDRFWVAVEAGIVKRLPA